jgi:uncharacterized protein YdcH (DUF465 family)
MIYKTQELYDLVEKLDVQIACLENESNLSWKQKCELSNLKADRIIIEDYIESLVSQAEDQMNEGGY